MGFFVVKLTERCITVVQDTSVSVLAPLYVHNRRDGSRLLSSALVIFAISTTQMHRIWGCGLAAVSGLVCLYWGLAYRRLDR